VSAQRTASIFSARIDRTPQPAQDTEDAPDSDDVDVVPDIGPPPLRWCEVAREAEILATLHAAALPHERPSEAFARKERELAMLFAQLSVTDARSLHRRLTITAASDPIARKFGQMVIDRQQRLITFLADARRREALQQSGVKR
jgi:hypothetical protein